MINTKMVLCYNSSCPCTDAVCHDPDVALDAAEATACTWASRTEQFVINCCFNDFRRRSGSDSIRHSHFPSLVYEPRIKRGTPSSSLLRSQWWIILLYFKRYFTVLRECHSYMLSTSCIIDVNLNQVSLHAFAIFHDLTKESSHFLLAYWMQKSVDKNLASSRIEPALMARIRHRLRFR